MTHDKKAVPVTLVDRAKYFAGAAIAAGAPLEIMGASGVGLLIAAGVGAGAFYFSPEIRGFLLDHVPAPQQATDRKSKLSWWLTGESDPDTQNTDEGQSLPPSEPEPLDEMEALQPAQHTLDARDDLAAPTFAPSGPFYFSQVLHMFTPTLSRIYLGTLATGEHIFIPAHELCHTALSGATRGGKDHLIRQLMSQLCKAGAKCYLLDPNYTRYDLEARDPQGRACPEDWTPFDAWLKNDPRELIPVARKYQVIEHYLKAAYELVNQRMEKRGYAESLGAPQFLFINEIPAIVDEVPGTATYLKKILREGAKLGVFMVNASQDFQVGTIFEGVGGGIRKCYRTAFDVGSDAATQRALGLPVVNEGLGKGKVSLRCKDVLDTVFVPYVDNEALYQLLGPSTYKSEPEMDWQAEDELVSYMVGGSSYEERETPPALPVTNASTRYHSHATGRDAQWQRRAEREQRLRGASVAPVPAKSEERSIPTIEEVRAAFPGARPSKRDIQKRFDLTDYQAYKLYGQW